MFYMPYAVRFLLFVFSIFHSHFVFFFYFLAIYLQMNNIYGLFLSSNCASKRCSCCCWCSCSSSREPSRLPSHRNCLHNFVVSFLVLCTRHTKLNIFGFLAAPINIYVLSLVYNSFWHEFYAFSMLQSSYK